MEHEDRFEQPTYEFSNIRYMYVNNGGVANGDNDFIMQVETTLPSGIVDIQNLIMTPRTAKSFRDMFSAAVDNYESLIGEIHMGNEVSEAYYNLNEDSEDETEHE